MKGGGAYEWNGIKEQVKRKKQGKTRSLGKEFASGSAGMSGICFTIRFGGRGEDQKEI